MNGLNWEGVRLFILTLYVILSVTGEGKPDGS